VEICSVTEKGALRQSVEMPVGSPIAEIRNHSELRSELAVAWDQAAGFSVFGEKRGLQSRLEHGDRVELLRPLQADPKEARRLRAKLKGKA
jgi:uncharacterized protein